MQNEKVGIAFRDWELPIFERRLTQAGYSFEKIDSPVKGITLLAVTTGNVEALGEVLNAAEDEVALSVNLIHRRER